MGAESTLETVEALTELRTDVEELRRLVAEVKQALAPSEAALKARTEYLDRVLRDQLGQAEKRIAKASVDVEQLSQRMHNELTKFPAIVAEVDARRWIEQRRQDRRRMVAGVAAMTCGGFLAGLAGSWVTTRSNTPPPATATASEPAAAPVATTSKSRPASPKSRPSAASAESRSSVPAAP